MRRLVCFGVCLFAAAVPAGVPTAAQAATTGAIEGAVSPTAWAQEVEVCVAETLPSETCTVPEADGSYLLANLPLGGTRIEFIPSFRSRLLTQYYDHKSVLAEAATIVLTALNPTAKGIDADLIEGGAIEGTVTAAVGGEPLSEVEVCAASVGSPTVKSCDETGASGEYELHSLPGGSYGVGFRGHGKSAEFEPKTTLVAVAQGATTGGVDAALAKGAQIKGSVAAAATGSPLGDIAVCLFAAAGSKPERCTYSDEGGAYAFEGLPSGSYQVGFSLDAVEIGGEGAAGSDDGYESQYYDGVGTRAQATAIPLLAPAVDEGVDAALVRLPAASLPSPAPVAASPIVAAAPAIAEPKPRTKACGKGYRKMKVKGKARCVKVRKKAHREHKHKTRDYKHGGVKR
jgi:hypothetical protein